VKGAITGCCSATVLLPSEVVKAKTQVVVGNMEASSSDVYKKMIKRNGIRSLFVGFDAQIMRDAPFYAFFFGTYELNCYLFRTYVPSMPEELNYFMRYDCAISLHCLYILYCGLTSLMSIFAHCGWENST